MTGEGFAKGSSTVSYRISMLRKKAKQLAKYYAKSNGNEIEQIAWTQEKEQHKKITLSLSRPFMFSITRQQSMIK